MKILNRQLGTSMIEIMVSIFIMAIGLLGVASLQINAMKFEKGSSERAQASSSTYDLSERMRANAINASVDYIYSKKYQESYAVLHVETNDCKVNICTSIQIAENDKANWLNSLQQKLSGGTGYISAVPGTTIPTFDVVVMWKEQGFTVVDTTCPAAAAVPAGVRCFVTRVSP